MQRDERVLYLILLINPWSLKITVNTNPGDYASDIYNNDYTIYIKYDSSKINNLLLNITTVVYYIVCTL